MTLKEQKEVLRNKWKIVPLRGRSKTEAARNRRLIRRFSCPDSSLEDYLKRDAWQDDEKGANRVYLILARKEDKQEFDEDGKKKRKNPLYDIVGYFALACGMLYIPENERDKLNAWEEDFVQGYTDAIDAGLAYQYRYENLALRLFDEEKAIYLLTIGRKRHRARHDRKDLKEQYVQLVDDAFPSIEITHLCKNRAYEMPDQITIRFSHYVFWECIEPIILDIASKIGVQYLYLFAAERNIEDSLSARKLMNLYKNDLQFRQIEGLYMMKPEYDYRCISMFQEIADLPARKIRFWTTMQLEQDAADQIIK